MSLDAWDEALIIRYLLNELAADERQLLEQRYFLDDRLFESVCSIEEQLIRDFIRGELPIDQERRFEARYLQSQQLSEKVAFARLLMRSAPAALCESLPATVGRAASEAAAVPAHEAPVFIGSAAPKPCSGTSFQERLREFFRLRAVALVFVAAGLVTVATLVAVWVGLDNQRLRTELARSESQRSSLAVRLQGQAATPESNPAHKSSVSPGSAEAESRPTSPVPERTQGRQSATLAFLLLPGVKRGDDAGQRTLVIPVGGVDRVRLNLRFTPFGQYTSYRVVVSSGDGNEVSSRDLPSKKIPGPASALVIDLPAASLPKGDYIIIVKGRSETAVYEDLESYYFHVVRRSPPH